MRRPRLVIDSCEGEAVYHCVSRTVGGEFLFGTEEKEMLRRQLWILAEYCGLEVITYTFLSNHFHVLLRVPVRRPISDRELLRLFRLLYPKLKPQHEQKLARVEESMTKNGDEAQVWRKQQVRQMFCVSAFMKLFKMRFSIWFNARHRRKGTLWSERFKSVLVEHGDALRRMAAYIDLNCVRAGLVNDPKDYRFCGYAEAVSGSRRAQRGLGSLYGANWGQSAEAYRCILFAEGSKGVEGKSRIPIEEARRVDQCGGSLPLGVLLRCRIRYFTDGVVLGSEGFVATQIARFQKRNLLSQTMSPQPMSPVLGWSDIRVLSRMRQNVLG